MSLSFLKYFFSYIFKSKTRQKLLFLAIIGLMISSFSLTVIQGVMGGLQGGLIGRSKNVIGDATINFSSYDQKVYTQLKEVLLKHQFNFVPEYEIEVMLKNGNYISPAILHGMDFSYFTPEFILKKDFSELIVAGDLGRDLRSFFGSQIVVTSPAHTNLVFAEFPRQGLTKISDFYNSDLPEIDKIHAWIRLSFIQNLIRKRVINKIRFYNANIPKLSRLISNLDLQNIRLETWEQKNSTLVWALNLETRVMMFLFVGMSFLIGICIVSGFLIFYNKVRVDLSTFWILGLSRKEMFRLIYILGQALSLFFCFFGVALGVVFLLLLDTNQIVVMPEQFVERNIPVHFETQALIFSFFIPYLFATFFTHITFKLFKNENYSFLALIKRVS